MNSIEFMFLIITGMIAKEISGTVVLKLREGDVVEALGAFVALGLIFGFGAGVSAFLRGISS